MKYSKILLAALVLGAEAASAQQTSSPIERVALAHLRNDLPKGRIVIDDEVLASSSVRTAAERDSLAAVVPGSVVEAGPSHIKCGVVKTPSTCRLDVDAIVSVGRAKVDADSAVVLLSVRTQPVFARNGPPRVDYRVRLVKRGSSWVVVGRGIIGQS